jgi:hypothetical protein
MRKFLAIAAVAGAALTSSAALTTGAHAMTIGTPAGLSKAVSNVGQVQQVRWWGRGWGWRHRYWGAYGYYRPWRGYYRRWW